MKKAPIAIGIFLIAVSVFIIAIPIANDRAAAKTAERVLEIELPEATEYVESFSKAGKLVGNGNGMQYLGGILIHSRLTLEELQAYYAPYAKSEWDCVVERQTGREIQFVEHGTVSLRTKPDGDGYFIVYSWGSGPSLFQELDLRGH